MDGLDREIGCGREIETTSEEIGTGGLEGVLKGDLKNF